MNTEQAVEAMADAAKRREEVGRIAGLKEAAEIVRKYKPLDWLANEILEGVEE